MDYSAEGFRIELSNSRIIAKNTVFLIAGDMTYKLVMILFISVLARKIGLELFGVFMLAQILAGLAIVIANPGVSQILYRDVATNKESSSYLIGAAAILRLIFLPIGFGILMVASFLLGYSSNVFRIIAVVGCGVLILHISENYFSVFKAMGKVHLVMVSKGLHSLLLLAIVFILITIRLNVMEVAIAYLVKAFLVVIMVVAIGAFAGIRHSMPSNRHLVSILRRGFPLGLQTLMIGIYLYIDTVMISIMRTMEEVGCYQAAYRLVTSLNFIALAFTIAIFPIFVRLYASRRDRLEEAYYRSMKYLLVVGSGMMAGTTVLSEKIIALFYGAGFSSSIRLLQILIWSEILIFLSFACASILLAFDRRWVLFWQTILAALLNIVINLPAIYYLGAIGAAITTVITEMLALCFLLWQVNKIGIKVGYRLLRDLGRIIIACAVMSIVLMQFESLPVVILVLLGAIIYFVILVLSRSFDTEDMRLIRQALNMKRI